MEFVAFRALLFMRSCLGGVASTIQHWVCPCLSAMKRLHTHSKQTVVTLSSVTLLPVCFKKNVKSVIKRVKSMGKRDPRVFLIGAYQGHTFCGFNS